MARLARRSLVLAPLLCALVVGLSVPAGAASSPWHVVRTGNPSSQANYLSAVATLSPTDAWAVGAWYRPIGTPGTLTQHWDGSAWRVVKSPNATPGYNELYAVAALATDDVWAVGYHNIANYGSEKTMIVHWNGAGWSIVPSPNNGPNANFLYGVSVVSATDVWAVGEGASTNISTGRTLAMHWDGARWRMVPTPNVGSAANVLYEVTAVSSTDVWAVGESPQGALTLHFDGASWAVVPNPADGSGDAELLGVAAASSTDVWAVGSSEGETLAEHWDGSTWSIVPTPNGPKPSNALSSVAVDATGAWAVGASFDDVTVTYRTLTERWNGTSWTLVASPNPDRDISSLSGVAGDGERTWAVGSSASRTIALRA